jgi:hypothetical protein
VTVKPNETWTCTFNNTTNTGTIKVIKKVDGTQVPGWTFGASTDSPTTVAPPSGQTDAQGELDFALSLVLAGGSPLTITETLQPGFSFQNASCADGPQNVPIDVDGLAGTLTVNPGDEITCTFNNSSIPVPPAPPKPPVPASPAGVSVASVARGALPFTGSALAMLLKIALWLLAIGLLCMLAVRIRRRRLA